MSKKIKYQLKLLIFVVVLLFPGIKSWGQKYDSTFYPIDSASVLTFHNKLDRYSPVILKPVDTSLVDFEAYNPLDTLHLFYASLGNVGLAYKNLDFIHEQKVGFDYGINSFNAYFVDEPKVKYYLNPRAYTEVGYVTGAKKEQLFKAQHHQRVFKRMALGVDFDLINSLGTYQRQKSDDNRVVASAQFFTKNLRYGIIANYSNARVKARENGGILYDSVYEENLEPDRSIIEVRLNNADNLLRKSGVYLQQYFQLSGKDVVPLYDSTAPVKPKKFQLKFGRIAHSFKYNRYSQVYTDSDPDINYYPHIYVDSTETYDSVFFQTMENCISWSNADYLDRLNPQAFRLLFGVKYQVGEVRDSILTSSFQNVIPYGEIRLAPHPFIKVYGRTSYVLSGEDYQGDYNIYGLGTIEILRQKPYKTSFNFAMDLSNAAAPYFYRHYFSNHFSWHNDYSKVSTNKISAFIKQRYTKLGIDIVNISDYLYIGSDTLPAQFDKSVEIFKAYLHQKFILGKFDLDSRFIYQKTSEKDVVRLPDFMAYFTLTFNLQMFKGALNTRTGFDVYYFTKYYADSYMPAIRSFYIQNEREIGGYVHADFFLDFIVARTRFFMKMQNILSPLVKNEYYQVPHYPLQDMAFKFGLSWRFND